MAIITRIACDGSRFGSMIACPFLDITASSPEYIPDEITVALAAARWSVHGDAYYCPRHNPDTTGLRIVLGHDYIEPVPGIRIRLSDDVRIEAELLLDPKRYRVTRDGGLWEATHVSDGSHA